MNRFLRPSTWIILALLLLLVPVLPFVASLLTANTDPNDWPNTWEFGYYGDLTRVKRLIRESGCAEEIQLGAHNRDVVLEEVELKVKTKWGDVRLIEFDASKNYDDDVKQQIQRLCQPST